MKKFYDTMNKLIIAVLAIVVCTAMAFTPSKTSVKEDVVKPQMEQVSTENPIPNIGDEIRTKMADGTEVISFVDEEFRNAYIAGQYNLAKSTSNSECPGWVVIGNSCQCCYYLGQGTWHCVTYVCAH